MSAVAGAILTPDQRLRVFVSSTLGELSSERVAAREAIEQLRLTPVLFEIGARPHPPRELYGAYLEQSHVFVGIYGHEYGWVAPGMDRSGIEDEYVLASALPKLVYVRQQARPRDEGLERLLERIRAEGTVSYRTFEGTDELRHLVAEDLAVLVSERFDTREAGAPVLQALPVPVPLGPLVGRRDELAELVRLLAFEDARLVTLVGPGGVGKSRLALAAAHTCGDEFPDGAVPVFLGPLRDPAVVPSTIGNALGLAEDPPRSALDVLEGALQNRKVLLLLDNFEHLLDAAPVVSHVLEHCRGVKALATSRRPLALRGERVLRIGPLALPEPGAASSAVRSSDAVQLFETRAAAIAPGFQVDETHSEAVAAICRRLDGVPLALELAASRIRIFTPGQLLEQLEEGVEALGRGARDASERHQTLEAAIRWSYDLLDHSEKQAFRRLGAFRGGWSFESAAAVAEVDISDLEALVDHSLVSWEEGLAGPRFSMLETVRDQATRLLEASSEQADIYERHWIYFGDVAEAMYQAAPEGRQSTMTAALPDLDNFRAALERSIRARDDEAVRLAGALGLFWSSIGLIGEGRLRIQSALRAGPEASLDWQARAYLMLAWLASDQGDYLDGERSASEALRLARRVGDGVAIGLALRILGNSILNQGDDGRALPLLEEAVEVLGAAGAETARVRALGTLARCLSSRGEYERAARLCAEACDYDRRHGHDDHLAAMLVHVGIDLRMLGRPDDALGPLTEAAAICRRLAMNHNLAWALVEIARIHALAGDRDALAEVLSECLAIFTPVDDRHGLAFCLELGAALASLDLEHEAGARLLGAAGRIREDTGAALVMPEAEDTARDADVLRAMLGAEAFDREWERGRQAETSDALSTLQRLLASPRLARARGTS